MLSDSLFHSVNLNFLRTEALSFYKVPFVVCFCIRLLLSQDRLPFVQYSGGTFSRRLPCTPQTSPACHSPLPFTVVQMNPSSQSQEGRTQPGQTIRYHNPMKYGLKEANKSFKWGQTSSPRTCSVWLTQASPVDTTAVTRWHCVRPFLYMWGFSNLVENACLSSVDSWI